ncbi:uncharacterized protein CFAP97D2 isoform X3 [Stegostoma tigrinum]|uniref:uncharacterized protein CFAP97D2 isoform X3 n=1 Tax=Stegostoma tigrinum TaxID=3053191 RepID=UPI00202B0D17|nr:uncharacterized protein CFAP97D2 isoform X3 [Stegostoma tigrinum]
MYRAYQPIVPTGSKYLQEKWDRACYHEHRRKVKDAKSTIDNHSPETYSHLNLKFKKLKLEEDRLSIIERDNQLLLQKMSTIMRTTGRVDNKNEYKLKSHNLKLSDLHQQNEPTKIKMYNQVAQSKSQQETWGQATFLDQLHDILNSNPRCSH